MAAAMGWSLDFPAQPRKVGRPRAGGAVLLHQPQPAQNLRQDVAHLRLHFLAAVVDVAAMDLGSW